MQASSVSVHYPSQRPAQTHSGLMIKTWTSPHGQVIAVNEEKTLHFYVQKPDKRVRILPHWIEGISVPHPLPIHVASWQIFLSNTAIQLKCLTENIYKLYIIPWLNGGGNIISQPEKIWEHGRVPYEVDHEAYPIESISRKTILTAVDRWNRADTGFLFVPRTDEEDFLFFSEDIHEYCLLSSTATDAVNEQEKAQDKAHAQTLHSQQFFAQDPYIGKQGGCQYIRDMACNHLNNNDQYAQQLRNFLQGLAYAIGLYPEYKRDDRDNYLILEDNHLTDTQYKKRYEKSTALDMQGQFDFKSITLCPIYTPLPDGQNITLNFSLPGKKWRDPIGRKAKLSQGDIAAAKALFNVYQAKQNQGIGHESQQNIREDALSLDEVNHERSKTLNSKGSSLFLSTINANHQPQWLTLSKIGDAYFARKEWKQAAMYYATLLTDYQTLIETMWCYSATMILHIANWHVGCGHYFYKIEKNYVESQLQMQYAMNYLNHSKSNMIKELKLIVENNPTIEPKNTPIGALILQTQELKKAIQAEQCIIAKLYYNNTVLSNIRLMHPKVTDVSVSQKHAPLFTLLEKCTQAKSVNPRDTLTSGSTRSSRSTGSYHSSSPGLHASLRVHYM